MHVVRIPAPDDSSVLKLLEQFLTEHHGCTVHIKISPYLAESATNVGEFSSVAKKLNLKTGKRVFNASLDLKNGQGQLFFERTVSSGGSSQRSKPELSVGEAEFWFAPNNSNSQNFAYFWEIGHKFLAPPNSYKTRNSEVAESHLEKHAIELSAVATSIAQELSEAQIKLQLKAEENLEKQTKDFEERQEKLESEIAEKRAALAKEMDELDLRSSQHERRKLRQEITKELTSRLEQSPVSGSVQTSRLHVYFACALVFLGTLASAIQAVIAFGSGGSTNDPAVWFNALRFFGSSTLAVIVFFYFTGFQKRIAAEDTEYERKLEAYKLDINRASWIMETLIDLENDPNNKAKLPDAWLAGVTANLFESPGPSVDEDQNALDALGELLRAGAKVKLGSNGAELELDKPAAKKVGKDG